MFLGQRREGEVITIALVLASIAVLMSVTLPMLLADRTLRSAFSNLEDDFEQLREGVRSDLGRISRLKRSVQEVQQETTASTEPSPNGWSPERTAAQARILRRRGVNQ